MSSSTVPYPFHFDSLAETTTGSTDGKTADVTLTLKNVRGKIPSIQASRLRTMMLEAHNDPTKILAHACTYDGLSSRLVEEAGFPMVFLAGYAVASSYGLPDTGYIAMAEMCDKIRDVVRQVSLPVMADGDTGYGSPMNVKRTVESFANAGAAGVMIEDQQWPKREYLGYLVEFIFRANSGYLNRLWSHKGEERRFSRRSIRSNPSCLRCPQ
jgi:methylisocitrate lyase